jgi:hypothetical protein
MIKRLASDNTFDMIRRSYLEDNVQLSPHLEQVRKRWAAAFSLMIEQKLTDRGIVEILVKDYDVSETVAYMDLSSAKRLFADARQASKVALRYMVTQWAIEAFKMAFTKKDFKAMEKMLDRIVKANNLDKDDMDIPDPSTWIPPTQLISIDMKFYYSEFGQLISPEHKEEFNKLIEAFNKAIERSKIKDYFQPFNTLDIPHQEIDNESAE